MMHPFLRNLHLEIYGGSHDEKIGVRLIGLPAGEKIDTDELHAFLARRAPGSTKYGTRRKEADTPHFLSGMENDTLTGEILEAVIKNKRIATKPLNSITTRLNTIAIYNNSNARKI